MFDKNKTHMIPPIVEQKAQVVLDEKRNINERSNLVLQLEAIRDFCIHVIDQFERRIKRK